MDECEFFYSLCYKVNSLLEEYEKKLGDLEEEEGVLITTLLPQYYKLEIKLKDLHDYNEIKQTVMELIN